MPTRRELANAIRALAMDAVQRANSGHPGMPMGMADIAEVLWNDYLRHNPADPAWHNRDRFIISNGHGSMLLYSLLHLTGYDFPMQELENFRQLGSKTAGHPESHLHPAIETTTGPLGQGLANGVGMALAEKMLAARFNRPGHNIVDHHTYVLAGDGCMMEGVSHEACSLAGTLGLGKLIVFYDDNGISIDGEVDGWFTDDTPDRFRAYGWHVIEEVDGHDADAVKRAIEVAHGSKDKPTLICCQTVIGFGAPNKEGTAATHGAALGDEEVAAARKELAWEHPPFHIPEAIYEGWDARHDGAELQATWQDRFEAWKAEYPELAAEYERRMAGGLPADWDAVCEKALAEAAADESKAATRKSSQAALEALAPHLPELVGGSADLSGSNNTEWSGSKVIARDDADGNYVHFGVREFAMTAMANGMCLHGGFIPYVGTFLVFSDYARNAVRMAALMEVGSILVYTHDSIGLGEDGPTHQPIEHLASLRLIPNMEVWRPADRFETLVAWRRAVERRSGPVSLVLSRQGLPAQTRDAEQQAAVVRGGYTLVDCEGEPELIYIATGSEVHLAVAAAQRLAQDGHRVRVVAMPCHSVFDQQDAAYRESVLPAAVQKRISVEAGVPEFWYHYVGAEGRRFGMTRFGESAPGGDLFEHFGFTAERLVELAEEIL